MLGLGLRGWTAFFVCGWGAAVAAAGVAACGSSSNASGFVGGGEGQDGSAGMPEDTGAPPFDGSLIETEAAPPPPPATVTFVHASPSLNDARLCWTIPGRGDGGVLTDAAPFPSGAPMPASNFPGLPVGGAVQISPATSLAGASASGAVELYAIDAEVLAREASSTAPHSCEALLCLESPSASSTCLRPNYDYWHAGTLPAGAIAPSGPTFVALAGCLGNMLDPAASPSRCGPSWDPVAGNLHAEILPVAALSPFANAGLEAGALAIQSALLSPAIASGLADAGAVRVSFGPAGDASTVALLSNEDDLQPRVPVVVGVGPGLAPFGQLGFGVDGVEPDAAAPLHFWTSLAQAQSLVDPTADPRAYFGTRATYAVLVMGDPGSPAAFSAGDAGYDGRGLHVLVLASVPGS